MRHLIAGTKIMGENRCSYIMTSPPPAHHSPDLPSPPQSPGLLRREKVQYEENSLASCNPLTTRLQLVELEKKKTLLENHYLHNLIWTPCILWDGSPRIVREAIAWWPLSCHYRNIFNFTISKTFAPPLLLPCMKN